MAHETSLELVLVVTCCHNYRTLNLFLGAWELFNLMFLGAWERQGEGRAGLYRGTEQRGRSTGFLLPLEGGTLAFSSAASRISTQRMRKY